MPQNFEDAICCVGDLLSSRICLLGSIHVMHYGDISQYQAVPIF